jgi:hypothetical protein
MSKLKMNIVKVIGITLLCLGIMPLSIMAGDFDGSKPLYCALMDTVQCLPGGECQEVEAEEVNLPNFLVIDFKKDKITTTKVRGNKRTSKIENKKLVDGKLIVQGAEDGAEGVKDGLGWSIAINDTTGKMVLTGSGDGVGFVFFGACTPE